MRVGITATRLGASPAQLATLVRLLVELGATELPEGDCLGGDDQSVDVARSLGIRVVGHPPENPSARAFREVDEERPQRPYLVRNRDIVDETGVLIAMPYQTQEQLRSGTWSTVRYARRLGRRVIIIGRDGEVHDRPAFVL